MKKLFIPTVMILMAALYFGCAKKKTNVEFDIQYTSDIAIPTYSAVGVYTLVSTDISTMINDELVKNGTNADLVGEAKYIQFDIAVKTPTTSTLDNIKQLKFYINAYQLPEQQVSYKYDDAGTTGIPTGAKTANMNINDNNLKNRFMENSVYFKVILTTYSVAPASTITVTHKVHIKAITE